MVESDKRDAVEFLTHQHDEIRRRFGAVALAPDGLRGREFESLMRLLAVHETAEEEVVYPVLRQVGGGDSLVEARLAEEDKAKKMLVELERRGPDSPGFVDQLQDVKVAVEAHAEREEREVFPLLRSEVDDRWRAHMEAALRVAEALAPTHPHQLAPESAVGNLLVGPFLAVADRARDLLREAQR